MEKAGVGAEVASARLGPGFGCLNLRPSSRRSSKRSVQAEPLPPLPTPPRGEYGVLPKASEYQEGWELERGTYQDGAYLEMKAQAARADGGYGNSSL